MHSHEHRAAYEGGFHNYGRPLGIMMLNTRFARPPGDVGNARSFDYPVIFEVVEEASAAKVVRDQDPALLEPFIEAGHNLVDRGAVAITTSCGFLLNFQDELATELDTVPVFTSSLLQIPLIDLMIGDGQKIGVLTADENAFEQLNHEILDAYRDELVVEGVAGSEPFQATIIEGRTDTLDYTAVRDDVVDAANRIVETEEIGAIVFECTNLRPYIRPVQETTGLPVFDYLTLAELTWTGSHGAFF